MGDEYALKIDTSLDVKVFVVDVKGKAVPIKDPEFCNGNLKITLAVRMHNLQQTMLLNRLKTLKVYSADDLETTRIPTEEEIKELNLLEFNSINSAEQLHELLIAAALSQGNIKEFVKELSAENRLELIKELLE